MTWFIFVGDMLVMLFMVVVAAWVFYRGTDEAIAHAARIPLEDEHPDPGGGSSPSITTETNDAQPGDDEGKSSRGDAHA